MLTARAMYVIKHYYGLGVKAKPISEISDHFGGNPMKIKTIRNRALCRLKIPLAAAKAWRIANVEESFSTRDCGDEHSKSSNKDGCRLHPRWDVSNRHHARDTPHEEHPIAGRRCCWT